jgi:hypothetical protein
MSANRPSRHHLVAKSKGGKTRHNIVVLPRDWHSRWHELFGLLTPEEACEYISEVMQPGKTWTQRQLQELLSRYEH